ncbi:MAG: hypothetical protein E7403_01010 [Ruminococcaceae bacterium]|nr:hypothetical protein [Oscillospiraceae bacterium]
MNQFWKLFDVKSIVTLVLVFALVFIAITNKKMDENVFLLFSNVVTMVITYFFAKKNSEKNDN